MLWFNKKTTLREEGLFEGFTDWHSHILPGVDDGIQTMEESLKVLNEFDKIGLRRVWLTPHIMEDFPNTTQELRRKFDELKANWNGSLDIQLASENMLDTLFEERLENNDFLPIGDERNQLLVETSYYTPPYNMEELLDKARSKGYYLILAHPERYRYMEDKDYERLKNKGILFQMNLLSITGAYGETAKKKAQYLLNKGYINFLGSDIHRLEPFLSNINIDLKKTNHLDAINKIASLASND